MPINNNNNNNNNNNTSSNTVHDDAMGHLLLHHPRLIDNIDKHSRLEPHRNYRTTATNRFTSYNHCFMKSKSTTNIIMPRKSSDNYSPYSKSALLASILIITTALTIVFNAPTITLAIPTHETGRTNSLGAAINSGRDSVRYNTDINNGNNNNNNNNNNQDHHDSITTSQQQQQQTLSHPQPSSIFPKYVMLSNNSAISRWSSLTTNNQSASALLSSSGSNTGSSLSNNPSDQGGNESHLKRRIHEKICIGTSNRISGQSNKTEHYHNLVERYRNCTYVIGNLEITWLDKKDLTLTGSNNGSNRTLDLSFLSSIREITGHLLIAWVNLDKLSLPNLEIIRGRELFRNNAIFVIHTELKALELPNLREILAGNVGFHDNANLCHVGTINWYEILNDGYTMGQNYSQFKPPTDCPACHSACPHLSCWGPGEDMCQKFTKVNCPAQCDKGRCYGQQPRDCCHMICAGGCSGPLPSQCFACKHFNNDGECVQECPPMSRYNSAKFLWESNPGGKYAYGATCVEECPDHLLRDNGACVRSCPPDKRSHNGECVPCGGACPKECLGVDVVNSRNIELFANCTVIEGSINILESSFTGYAELNTNNTMGTKYEPMHPSRLSVFESIKTITGYLNIQAAHPDFKDLSFFSKLESIEGRQTTDMFHILHVIKTSLVSLNLRSLKRVRGRVLIEENPDLCFAEPAQFVKAGVAKEVDLTIRNNGNSEQCLERGLACHEQCGNSGCWGPGQQECLSCANYKLDDYCVNDCNSTIHLGLLSFKSGQRTCSRCHPECQEGCTGTSAKDCRSCRNYKDGPYCVSQCPKHKFDDNGICKECNKNCLDGCTGPTDKLGLGGCNSCDKVLIQHTSELSLETRCLKADEPCPRGYYQEYLGPLKSSDILKPLEKTHHGKPICRRCHPLCKSCNGPGTYKDVCLECAGYLAGDRCEESCPRDFYADGKTRNCTSCSRECNGCYGPTDSDCLNCRVYRIYFDSDGPKAFARVSGKAPKNVFKHPDRFRCASQCPPDKPHRISESNLLDPYCSEDPGPGLDRPTSVPLDRLPVWSIFLLIVLLLATCLIIYKRKTDIERLSTLKLSMRLSGLEDIEPMVQSHLKPNLEPLRSIKTTELRQGNKIGSGVGGTVYQGFWKPENQEQEAIAVAIKVLRDNGQANMNKEFLDEAYIMAKVNHPNLVKLLGVCNTPDQLILVTPLMPVGCLLDYVTRHKDEITPKNLLEWSKQIAKGMAYLEEQHIVHRDLALRNVLLQNKQKALISDFGLAKFLEVDQSEYEVGASGGTRLPIKWLAPECISHRIFTHKSDVWAFGVTIWELVTFGRKPFEELDTSEYFEAIKANQRLKSPKYVTSEVQLTLVSCWLYNPATRSDFKFLVSRFTDFARDPERYLVSGPKGFCDSESEQDKDFLYEYENESNNVDRDDDDDDDNNAADDDGHSPPHSARSDLGQLRQTNGGPAEFFEFETRQHHSESDTQNVGHLSSPSFMKKDNTYTNGNFRMNDVFSKQPTAQHIPMRGSNGTILDPNNNNLTSNNSSGRSNADSCWTMNQTISTTSLGHRSELPTDSDDYLMPSPSSNEEKFRFSNNHNQQGSQHHHTSSHNNNSHHHHNHNHHHNSYQNHHHDHNQQDPPHSAGLVGILNHEYFLTRGNYANTKATVNSSNSHNQLYPNSLV